MTTWMRCYWSEEHIWFYFEVDAQGSVQRQVELQGPESIPLAAASQAEWQRAYDSGCPGAYERRFGLTAEPPVQEWEGHCPEYLTADEFEQVWTAARRQILARPEER